MTDAELLTSHASDPSGPAFAELVRRHIDLVYASALRQTHGDPHAADDVTQAVFVVLSRRARSIRDGKALAGWLLVTTRYVAMSHARLERRRRAHERRAAGQVSETLARGYAMHDEHDDSDREMLRAIRPLLDRALAQLRSADRTAVALRYFHDKPLRDVAGELGISEEAARKRVSRAVGRMREFFERHGVAAPADWATALAAMPLTSAPPGLAAAILATRDAGASAAVAALAAAGGSRVAAFSAWAHAHAMAAVAASVAVLAGAGLIAVAALPTSRASAASPVAVGTRAAAATNAAASSDGIYRFSNLLFLNEARAGEYEAGVDPNLVRAEEAVGYVKSVGAKPSQGARMFAAPVEALRGKRIRISAWLKAQDVAEYAGIGAFVQVPGQQLYATDNMDGKPIFGTADWKRYAIEVDVPADAASVLFGAHVRGAGQLWMDDFRIETLSPAEPRAEHWHAFSLAGMRHYTVEPEDKTKRPGGGPGPTTRIASTDAGNGQWLIYDHTVRPPELDQFLGKRVRLTAWIKADRISANTGLSIRCYGENFKIVASEGQRGHRPITGTRDWKQYTVTCDVPPDTLSLAYGVTQNGKGTLWFQDVNFELAPDAP